MKSAPDGYGIGTLSKLTGLSKHTLRVWERRYGALEPVRTSGGTRRYGPEEIARARALAGLVSHGFRIGEVAKLSIGELHTRLEPHFQTCPHSITTRFLNAVKRFDVEDAEELLFTSATVLPTLTFLTEVAAPLLQEIGRLWELGHLRIAHEHAASRVIHGVLARVRNANARKDWPVCVVTTLAEERHELGALSVSLVATLSGFRPIYLGPDLPADEIAFAVAETDADYLALSLVHGSPAALEERLSRVEDAVRERTSIVIGGGASPSLRPTRAAQLNTLVELFQLFSNAR